MDILKTEGLVSEIKSGTPSGNIQEDRASPPVVVARRIKEGSRLRHRPGQSLRHGDLGVYSWPRNPPTVKTVCLEWTASHGSSTAYVLWRQHDESCLQFMLFVKRETTAGAAELGVVLMLTPCFFSAHHLQISTDE
ncbi:hypothetical protein RRG08_039802 [Elysia crispata]|uniref:Uncharacterized protein n=1 Tax=Elysia crispata TaxID=231223 RepID=A0AAE1E4S9_9GAST|nr:hypothetical protein RRG08_039802 [Elysia crispata]